MIDIDYEFLHDNVIKHFNNHIIGRCKTLQCKTEADCKEIIAGTMLMHSKMKCVHKDNQNKVGTINDVSLSQNLPKSLPFQSQLIDGINLYIYFQKESNGFCVQMNRG